MPRAAIHIVAPCYNENTTVIKFLDELDAVLGPLNIPFVMIIVDDSSTDNTLELLSAFTFRSPDLTLNVISLKYNQGHQSAIYQGLLFAHTVEAEQIIVMDADGEDDPRAVIELAKPEYAKYDIVNVIRGKRKEKFSFKLFYAIYKLLFRFITHRTLDFGNYCKISQKVLDTILDVPFIHFAAYLSKQNVPTARIIFDRRVRLDGKSKMKLDNLVHHAFKSFIEYAEELLMVFLRIFILTTVIIVFVIAYIFYEKLFTNNAVLGWASTLSATLITIAMLCLGFFVIGILLLNILSKKEKSTSPAYKIIK